MNTKRMMLTSSFLMVAATGTAVGERIPCETSTRENYSYVCSYGQSGNYSQLNTELSGLSDDLENAGLCAPTAISAALDQLLDRTSSVSGSWLARYFESRTRRTRIINVAGEVGWIEGAGTSESGVDWFQNRNHDIDPAYTAHKDHAKWTLFAPQTYMLDTYFRDHLEDGEGMVLHRTKYDESCAYDWWGNLQCNYTEDTDARHLQAVNGTMTRASDGMWRTRLWQSHNSGGPSATAVADEQIRDFQTLPVRGTDDHRPNGAYTAYFYKSGNRYSIVTRVHRIATH